LLALALGLGSSKPYSFWFPTDFCLPLSFEITWAHFRCVLRPPQLFDFSPSTIETSLCVETSFYAELLQLWCLA